jgi:hypothetical protein
MVVGLIVAGAVAAGVVGLGVAGLGMAAASKIGSAYGMTIEQMYEQQRLADYYNQSQLQYHQSGSHHSHGYYQPSGHHHGHSYGYYR